MFLDSAMTDGELGRYSFVAADPCRWIERPMVDDHDLLAGLEDYEPVFQSDWICDLPPFQGGLAGLFGYELARVLSGFRRRGTTSSGSLPWQSDCTMW